MRSPRTREEFVARVTADGWSTRRAGSGHLLVIRPNGTVATTASNTASDPRAWLNSWRDYRRARRTPPRKELR